MTRLMSVLLPDPLDPTSAVVDPAAALNDTCLRTGAPGLYSNVTSSNSTSPRMSSNGARSASSSSSVDMRLISRMRSSPANASVICVPMLASWMMGIVSSAIIEMYMKRSPIVIDPDRIEEPPISMTAMPIAPITSPENAPIADTPVSDLATLRNSRCAPFANTSSSRFSAVYALTMRTPPSDSPSRPVTSALIWPRSRKSGRKRLKAVAMPPPNAPSTRMVTAVSFQFR